MREETMLTANDGAQLHLTVWRPEGAPKMSLVMVHGFGEYGGRYDEWANRFAREGIAVYLHDQRGHGRTPGPRGVVPCYDCFLDDMALVVSLARHENSDKPMALYGHSMGGNIALNYLIVREQAPFCCAVITSPWLRLTREPPRALLWVLSGLSRLMPGMTIHTKLKPERLTHESDIVERVRKDEYYHNTLGVRIAGQIISAGRRALRRAAEISTPVLLLSGGQDQVVSPLAISEFAKQSGPSVKHIDFPDMFHEVHNETKREDIFAMERDFFMTHMMTSRE